MVLKRLLMGCACAVTTLMLAACGGGEKGGTSTDTSGARGSLVQNPPLRLVSLTADEFKATLNASSDGAALLQVTGNPVCGVEVHYMEYGTVGAAATPEATNATGALMVPNGSSAACSGPRPIVLYAHGTTTSKGYNIAAITDASNAGQIEGALIAAMFVAQGYIVVAPNYAGYDKSRLGYHPYLVADQQSKDMIDALAAAKKALPNLLNPVSASAKLFITGYSQGGHVAMATHRALEAAGTPVTALVGQSGPYALSTLVDATFAGAPNLGGTVFTPLLTTSWQKAYGNIYSTPGDIFTTPFASGIDTLLPTALSFNALFTSGKLPQAALFDTSVADALALAADSSFRAFYGTPSLVNTTYALGVAGDVQANPCPTDVPPPASPSASAVESPLACTPGNKFRVAARANDLRTYTPASPVLLCGGNADPTVFFTSSQLTKGYFDLHGASARVKLVDVDSTPTAGDGFDLARGGFAQAKAKVASDAAAATSGDANAKQAAGVKAVTLAYHGTLVPPFCSAVARGFFSSF
ncbi:MAG: hypothetical protein RIQ60_27 [Pseudomonadota bacterium]|jgi:hypothetical protein